MHQKKQLDVLAQLEAWAVMGGHETVMIEGKGDSKVQDNTQRKRGTRRRGRGSAK